MNYNLKWREQICIINTYRITEHNKHLIYSVNPHQSSEPIGSHTKLQHTIQQRVVGSTTATRAAVPNRASSFVRASGGTTRINLTAQRRLPWNRQTPPPRRRRRSSRHRPRRRRRPSRRAGRRRASPGRRSAGPRGSARARTRRGGRTPPTWACRRCRTSPGSTWLLSAAERRRLRSAGGR